MLVSDTGSGGVTPSKPTPKAAPAPPPKAPPKAPAAPASAPPAQSSPSRPVEHLATKPDSLPSNQDAARYTVQKQSSVSKSLIGARAPANVGSPGGAVEPVRLLTEPTEEDQDPLRPGEVRHTKVLKNGNVVTTSTYPEDGADVSVTSTFNGESGYNKEQTDVTRDGTTNRTVVTSQTLEDEPDLQEEFADARIPSYDSSEGVSAGLYTSSASYGEPSPITQTHTVESVIRDGDNRVTSDFTTKSQTMELQDLDPHYTDSPTSHPLDPSQPASLTLTETSVKVDHGRPVDSRILKADTQLHAIVDGESLPVSTSNTLTSVKDKYSSNYIPLRQTQTTEGFETRDDLTGQRWQLDDKYVDKLPQDPVPSRQTHIRDFIQEDGGIRITQVGTTEFGDYAEPDAPGARLVTYTTPDQREGSKPTSVTFRRADATDDGTGVHIQQQTNFEGSQAYTLLDETRTTSGPLRGELHRLVEQYDGEEDEPVNTFARDVVRADSSDVLELARGLGGPGQGQLYDEFLKRNSGHPLFVETTQKDGYTLSTSAVARGSEDRVTRSFPSAEFGGLGELIQEPLGDNSVVILERPGARKPVVQVAADGTRVELEGDRVSEVGPNGERHEVELEEAEEEEGGLEAVTENLDRVSRGLRLLLDKYPKGTVGSLDLFTGASELLRADDIHSRIKGGAFALTGAGDLGEVILGAGRATEAVRAAESSRLLSGLESAPGKLGAAGGALLAGVGVYELASGGDKVDATTDIVAGVATTIAAFSEVAGPYGLAIAGGALAIDGIYHYFKDEETQEELEHKTADLKI